MYDRDWILSRDDKFRYMLLNRMQCDCEFYLGYGNRNADHLWAANEVEQIVLMKELWNSFPQNEKPQWLSWEQILDFEKEMCPDQQLPHSTFPKK